MYVSARKFKVALDFMEALGCSCFRMLESCAACSASVKPPSYHRQAGFALLHVWHQT